MRIYVALVRAEGYGHRAEVWTVQAKTRKGARRKLQAAVGAPVVGLARVQPAAARHWSVD